MKKDLFQLTSLNWGGGGAAPCPQSQYVTIGDGQGKNPSLNSEYVRCKYLGKKKKNISLS